MKKFYDNKVYSSLELYNLFIENPSLFSKYDILRYHKEISDNVFELEGYILSKKIYKE